MKFLPKASIVALTCVLTASAWAADAVKAPTAVDLSSDTNKLSYVMGLNAGMNLKSHGVQIDPTIFLRGMQDAFSGAAPSMTPAQIEQTLKDFQKQMTDKQQKMMKDMAVKNKTDGETFMKSFQAQAGVQALSNGIYYKVVKTGTGAVPKMTDSVKVTYEGKLVNGKVFDSTNKNGKDTPVSLPIAQLIPGMQAALVKMPVGSTWQIAIPAAQGYGEKGVGPIEPNETLIFTISVLGIDAATPATK